MKKKPATKRLYSDPTEKKPVAKKATQSKKSSEEKKKQLWELSTSEDEAGDFKPAKAKKVAKKQPAKK